MWYFLKLNYDNLWFSSVIWRGRLGSSWSSPISTFTLHCYFFLKHQPHPLPAFVAFTNTFPPSFSSFIVLPSSFISSLSPHLWWHTALTECYVYVNSCDNVQRLYRQAKSRWGIRAVYSSGGTASALFCLWPSHFIKRFSQWPDTVGPSVTRPQGIVPLL